MTERLRMEQNKKFPLFLFFPWDIRKTYDDNNSPTEMTEITERLRMEQNKKFLLFPLFPWDIKRK